MPNDIETFEMAMHLYKIGINPVLLRGKIPTEKGWQAYRQTEADIKAKFGNGNNIGACCGPISGGLEDIDFDSKGEVFDAWTEKVKADAPDLYPRLAITRTPSGGFHVDYFCPEIEIPGNTKLACKRVEVPGPGKHEYAGKKLKAEQDGDGWVIWPELVETRGAGGQMAIFPSFLYKIIQPGEAEPFVPPQITAAERDILINAAKSFDEKRPEQKTKEKTRAAEEPKQQPGSTGTRPGDGYNARVRPRQVYNQLVAHGWTKYSKESDRIHLTRPGKDVRDGKSGTLFFATGVFHCFSSNASPFENEKNYSPFAVYVMLEYAGDFSKAAAQLNREGRFQSGGSKPAPAANSDDLPKLCRQILQSREAAGDFDMSKLPTTLTNYVNSISELTAADPVMILQSAICTASALLKKRAFIGRDSYFQVLYPNLYLLTVANSGTFKTTAQRKGMRLAFETNKRVDEEIELLSAALKVGSTPGENEVNQLRIENAEKRRPLLPSKMTPEAMLQLLSADCGGMIAVNELGEWLANLTKSHNADFKGLITDFYDSPKYYRYRTKNHGDFVIERPFITINAVSTLRWLADYLDANDVESGFFARFLIFCPPRKVIIPPALPNRHFNTGHQSYEAFKNAITTIEGTREYFLTQEASEKFDAIHMALFGQYLTGTAQSELLEPFIKRWGPYVLKLSIIMQLMVDPQTDQIGLQAVQSAYAVVEYAIKSTLHLFRAHFELPTTAKLEQKVLDYIAKRDGRVTRHVLQSSRILDGGSKIYDEVITSLSDQGRILVIENDVKKYERYWLNEEKC